MPLSSDGAGMLDTFTIISSFAITEQIINAHNKRGRLRCQLLALTMHYMIVTKLQH